MKKSKREDIFQITIGDIFAVPLGDGRYGYIRAYHDPFFAIFNIVSNNILDVDVLRGVPIIEEASILTDEIENKEWPYIGNWPFAHEDEAWPIPRKQPVPWWNPDVRFVIVKGQYIPDHIYGVFDELPDLIRLDAKDLIAFIMNNCT